jgi:hypothetical protein
MDADAYQQILEENYLDFYKEYAVESSSKMGPHAILPNQPGSGWTQMVCNILGFG